MNPEIYVYEIFHYNLDSVRKRSVLYDHDKESRKFLMGGGGGDKNDKNVIFFAFAKKGRGQRIPSPSLYVVSGEAVNIEFFYFRNNAESD